MVVFILSPLSSRAEGLVISRNLTLGSQGSDVSSLQTFLEAKGFYTFSTITGYYGPVTEAAVKGYQESLGIDPIGSVGPLTRAALASAEGTAGTTNVTTPVATSALDITATLSLGSTGDEVTQLQEFLQTQGFYTFPTVTGYFGSVTEAAVKAYQRSQGIDPIGIVGPQTRAALVQSSTAAAATRAGTSSSSTSTTTSVPSSPPIISGGEGGGGFSSSPPPDVTPPVISTISTGSIVSSSATISWTTDEAATSQVIYGLTSAYGATTTLDSSLITSHSVALSGLTPSTTYHYEVISSDSSGNKSTSTDQIFTTNALGAPAISSIASSTTQTTATISWTTDQTASSTVAYGTTTAYGSASTSPALVTSHSILLSGLTAATTYHFQVGGANSVGTISTSSDMTFTTTATADTMAPTVSLTAPLNGATVSGSSVTLSATASDNIAVAGVTFEVNGSVIGSEVTSAPYQVAWNTTATSSGSYSIVAVARDTSNNYATSTAEVVTVDNTPPVISSISSGTPGQTAATITWTTNENANSRIDFGTTSSYGTASTSAAFVTSHSIVLSGLTAATMYHYRVQSADSSGNTATSSDQLFTTASVAAPMISSIASSTTQTTATITWTTDQTASSTVNYGTSIAYGTASTSPSLVTSHSITLSGLTSSTTYHFQVGGANSVGTISTSSDMTFTTTAGVTPDGTLLSSSIEPNGFLADISLKDMAPGGTYTLNPDSSPTVVFNVTSKSYDSTGAATTANRTVYGTVPYRLPYPNGGTTAEVATSTTNLNATLTLSDDILPTDTVTLSALSGWYTQATSSLAVSNLPVTNNSTTTEYRPIGAWITPTNMRRAAGSGMTVEFFVSSKYPKNNGQVAAVKFTASDGTNTVSHTASTMSQSSFLFSTTCTATNGSPTLTSCGSITGLIPGQFITLNTGTTSAVSIGEPKISSIATSTSQVTLNTNAVTSGTVTLTLGNPVYVYSVTFTNAELNTLAQGVATVNAIAYTNVGTITLDTSQGADGNPIAAGTITPNLKNLQFLNDVSGNYVPVYAWVSPSGAGASPAVQTTATDPGSTAYYGTIKTAADALKTYYNLNLSHNNACGGVIYLKVGTTTGFGGDLGSSGDSPTNCATYLTISAEPGHGPTDTDIDAGTSANRGAGYTTIIKNLHLTDNATNKIVIAGPDAATATARVAHNVFQNDWLQETQSPASAFINQVGWREYYNSLLDQSPANSSMVAAFSTTGVTNSEFGSTMLASTTTAIVWLYTSVGNVYSGLQMIAVPTTSANFIVPTSAVSAFDKIMNLSSIQNVGMTGDGQAKNNYAFAQDVIEALGTTNTSPAFSFGADDDVTPFTNMLREYATVVGNRTNILYNSLGGTLITKTANMLFNIDYQRYSKSDYFLNPLDRFVTNITITNPGSGYTNATVTIAPPTGVNGVTALAHATISGGTIASTTLDVTICGNTGGEGYSAAPTVTINGDGTGATATASISASMTGQPCGTRQGNWRFRFGVGDIGNVVTPDTLNTGNPGFAQWIGDYLGLAGNTSTPGYNQSSFTWKAANQNSSAGGNNTGLGWYKPSVTTGLTNRVPSGDAGFPGDIEGTPRKDDGTGCAGAYECN
jgi:peptidoglycan hydrolase-like protein with peptidoglycan-binding domain